MTESPDKREQLLNVAEDLFAELGFDGTSIRMIADAAGMNVAMVSYYFGSKEKMLDEVITRRTQKMGTISGGALLRDDLDAWQKLGLVIEGYVDRFTNDKRRFHQLMMRELSLRKRPEIVQRIEERLNYNMQSLFEIYKDGVQKKIFRSDLDFSFCMTMMFGSLNHAAHADRLLALMKQVEGKNTTDTPDVIRERAKVQIKTMMARHMLADPAHYGY